jgi:hypothetical protein
MANVAAKVASTPYSITYTLTGDGTVTSSPIASATLITDSEAGPLRDLLSASYANQAAMRLAFTLGDPAIMLVTMRTTVNDVTAEANQVSVDVDVDAITATRPEINYNMSDTTGQVAILHIRYFQSSIA